jgi:hypothetical protein
MLCVIDERNEGRNQEGNDDRKKRNEEGNEEGNWREREEE